MIAVVGVVVLFCITGLTKTITITSQEMWFVVEKDLMLRPCIMLRIIYWCPSVSAFKLLKHHRSAPSKSSLAPHI